MTAPTLPGHVVRFGVFEADLRAGELHKQGLRVKLQPQPFQILTILLEHAGELVTREELRRKLWPSGVFVDFEHSLNSSVKKLREALGEDAGTPRYIETLPRRGYRFVGTVAPVELVQPALPAAAVPAIPFTPTEAGVETGPGPAARPAEAPPSAPDAVAAGVVELPVGSPRRRRAVAMRLAAVAAASAALAWFVWRRIAPPGGRENPPTIRSIGVLPFENLSGDPQQDYLADGLTEQLITDLGQISALHVISRTSVMQYRRTRRPLPQIARELRADAIVEGTVLRSGDRVRVTANLLHARDDRHLWSETYERDLTDVLILQEDIARAIAGQVRATLTLQQRTGPAHAPG